MVDPTLTAENSTAASPQTRFRTVVAGHICLDVIPGLDHLAPGSFKDLFQPGRLITAGPALFSTGGPVSNTGLALHRLGVPTRLIGKVGADPFGQIVRGLVEQVDPALAEGLVTDLHSTTSYSVIISPPEMDRIFLHCPGANDTFGAEDVDEALVGQADLFHFGYPPIMQRMYQEGGIELAEVMRKARAAGATTSLDMAYPDPSSASGRADWYAILRSVLPFVDIFQPSVEEILFMLRRDRFEQMVHADSDGQILEAVTPELLSDLACELIDMGVKIVVIKLGSRGLYLRTAGENAIGLLGRAAPVDQSGWAGQELWAPCFQVHVVGTTGSGDATIAGFLSALLRGFSPQAAVTAAVAVGACNCEAADALSSIRSWEDTQARIQAGWKRHTSSLSAPGWHWDAAGQVWVGPAV